MSCEGELGSAMDSSKWLLMVVREKKVMGVLFCVVVDERHT